MRRSQTWNSVADAFILLFRAKDIDWDNLGFGLDHVGGVSPVVKIYQSAKHNRNDFRLRDYGACECSSCLVWILQTMYFATCDATGAWNGTLEPYGPLPIMPSAQVLNYGQAIFEGMKAQRSSTGEVVLFRPDQNAARMQQGATRLCMPQVPTEMFIKAVTDTVVANKAYVSAAVDGTHYPCQSYHGLHCLSGADMT